MGDDELLERWRRDARAPFAGWDFSYLGDRYVEERPPWSYEAMARELLAGAASMLDVGTGGGEFVRSIADALPPRAAATEGWAANVPVAREALASFGIDLFEYDADTDPAMPFPDGSFDVVLNRHESYDAGEVARILAPGGVFLTQQVGGDNDAELYSWFGHSPESPDVTLINHRSRLEAAGLQIERAEDWSGRAVFADVGALVYYLVNVPWEAPPDFSVDRYGTCLLDLHRSGTPIVTTARRFVLIARQPALHGTARVTSPNWGSCDPNAN